jgi:diguanylate cyclase (GGDEF)-like protein
MAKSGVRAAKPLAGKPRPPAASRTPPRAQDEAASPRKSPQGAALARRLAAEVERLEAELAAARTEAAALAAKAERDPLTDVLNRRGFERELERALSYVERYGGGAALIYLDLDGFKPVNDRHGHAAGDAVLKAVARALVHHVRASDLVARLGGDEFALLLWNIAPDDADAKAVAMEDLIATATQKGPARGTVGASAGVTMMTVDDTPAEALARADAAMYARKTERKATGSR